MKYRGYGSWEPWERRSAPGDLEKLEINVAVWFCVMNSPAIRHEKNNHVEKDEKFKLVQFYNVVILT